MSQSLRISATVHLEQHGVTAFLSYRDAGPTDKRWCAEAKLRTNVFACGFGATELECLTDLHANIRALTQQHCDGRYFGKLSPERERDVSFARKVASIKGAL